MPSIHSFECIHTEPKTSVARTPVSRVNRTCAWHCVIPGNGVLAERRNQDRFCRYTRLMPRALPPWRHLVTSGDRPHDQCFHAHHRTTPAIRPIPPATRQTQTRSPCPHRVGRRRAYRRRSRIGGRIQYCVAAGGQSREQFQHPPATCRFLIRSVVGAVACRLSITRRRSVDA